MMSNNKILTVSYGTFSCTLEGFDDSFGTMTAIAEYFRDLAADDRYFGAEPPQPDADMLARIAPREISRRVEAREKDGQIMLRAQSESPLETAAPGPSAASLVAAAASARTQAATASDDVEDVLEEPVQDLDFPSAEETAAAVADEHADTDAAVTAALSDDASLEEDEASDEPVTESEDLADEEFADREDVAAFAEDFAEETDDLAEIDALEASVEEFLAEDLSAYDAPIAEAEEMLAEDAGLPPHREGIAAKLQRIRDVVMRRQDGVDVEFVESTPAAQEVAPGVSHHPSGAVNATLSAAARDIEDALAADDALDATNFATGHDLDDVFAEGDIADDMAAEAARSDFDDDTPATTEEDGSDTEAPHAAAVSAMSIESEAYDEEYDDDLDLSAIRSQLSDAMGVVPESQDADGSVTEANVFAYADEIEDVQDAEAAGADSIVAADMEDDLDDAAGPEGTVAIGYGTIDEAEADDHDDVAFDDDDFDEDDAADYGLADEDDDVDYDDDYDDYEPEAEKPLLQARVLEASDADLDIEEVELLDETAETGHFIDEDEDEAGLADDAEAATGDSSDDEAAAIGAARPYPNKHHRAAADDADVARLMAEAEEQMGDPEGSLRRRAFSHLRAAVAAKKADQALGSEEEVTESQTAYRSDLAEAVKPRRPVLSEDRGERRAEPRPAPLKLVAEQRIDVASERPAGPVQPRRVATLAPTDSMDDEGEGFAAFAEAKGAVELSQLLEAAAAYLSFVEGRDDFSRQQLMQRLRQVKPDEYSREDSLRSFGQLIRSGKIEKIRGGRFAASDRIGFKPDHRAAG